MKKEEKVPYKDDVERALTVSDSKIGKSLKMFI